MTPSFSCSQLGRAWADHNTGHQPQVLALAVFTGKVEGGRGKGPETVSSEWNPVTARWVGVGDVGALKDAQVPAALLYFQVGDGAGGG